MNPKPDLQARPSREEAEEAVRTLLRWVGEDPGREGLRETPARVAKAYLEWCGGYGEDPAQHLERSFGEVEDYGEIVLLRDIRFESLCEHHLAPIVGRAHVAYLPSGGRVVGISKLARVVEAFSKRLQVQEKLTAQIADCLEEVLKPRGVAVAVEAEHHCMTTCGVRKHGVGMITTQLRGDFRADAALRAEFMGFVNGPRNRL